MIINNFINFPRFTMKLAFPGDSFIIESHETNILIHFFKIIHLALISESLNVNVYIRPISNSNDLIIKATNVSLK